MRATLQTVALTLSILLLTALPALATEGGTGGGGSSDAATGTFSGVLLGMILGIIFGLVVVVGAYRSSFGSHRGHQEAAHDLRDGIGAHEPGHDDVPQRTTPTASGG